MKNSELEEMAGEEYDEMNREETPLELLEKKMLIKLQEERKGKGKGTTMTKKEMKILKIEVKKKAAKAMRDVTPEGTFNSVYITIVYLLVNIILYMLTFIEK